MKDTDELKILCRNIKYLRKQHSLSRKEMAKICHINIITLIFVELEYWPAYVTVDIFLDYMLILNIGSVIYLCMVIINKTN